jgi:hypothetical protein
MTGKLLFGGTKTNGDGVAFRLGVNRTNIRQLLLANTAVNTANPIVRVSLGATSATSYIYARQWMEPLDKVSVFMEMQS